MGKHKRVEEDLDEYIDDDGSSDESLDDLIEEAMVDINDILLDAVDKIEEKVRNLVDDAITQYAK